MAALPADDASPQVDETSGGFFSYSLNRLTELEEERKRRKEIRKLAKTDGRFLYPDQTTVTLKPKSTIASTLEKGGADQDINSAIEVMRPHFNPKKFKSGQEITIFFTEINGRRQMAGFKFNPDLERTIMVLRHPETHAFQAQVITKELTREIVSKSAVINTALTVDGQNAEIHYSVLSDLISVYSWDIDFQRDIRKNDRFEVMFEVFYDEEGRFVRAGDLLYANLELRGEPIEVYRFETSAGDIDYFKKDGVSVRRALMRTPIDGARLSSHYGMRHHPILGYNKMHKGTDFAAPVGTPIYAAGDGIIESIGRNGGYGNYIRIRHKSDLHTAYAHLKGFAKGMHKGKRVKQKQVIGYLGSTGRSTGPHLHYEVHLNRRQVNPRTVKLPKGIALKSSDKRRFSNKLSDLETVIAKARKNGDSFILSNR